MESDSFQIPKLLLVPLCLLFFIALLTPIITSTYGLDGRFHLYWIQQFTQFNAEGVLFPRWIPSSFWGFGSTAFYFYPPLTYYFASLIRSISGITTPTTLFQIISFLASVASFFSMRVLLKSIGSSGRQRTVASALYVVAPLRFAELYHRGDLSTHVSYVFIPLVWYALVQLFRKDRPSRAHRIVLLSITATLLLLTSVPVAMVTAICVLAAGITQWKKLRAEIIVDISIAAVLTLALSAFHFAAAISALPFTWLDLPNFHLLFNWHTAFWPINWLAVYELSFVYGPVGLILIAFLRSVRKHENLTESESTVGIAAAGVLALILFLEFPPLSRNLWNTLMPLQAIGLNWRLYSQILIGVCLIVGTAQAKRLQRAAILSLGILLLGALVPAFLAVSNQHLYPHFSRPLEDAMEYRPMTAGWRADFERRMPAHRNDPAAMANFQSGEFVERVEAPANVEVFNASLTAPTLVIFHRFYWPYWCLFVNGQKIPTMPDSLGRATATLTAGHYLAKWELERAPLERAGLWIFGVTVTGLLILSGIGLIRQRVRKKRSET